MASANQVNRKEYITEIGNDVQKAASLLEEGELVSIPTETVYGLAGNALDPRVVVKIFEVKNRPYFDPLIVHLPHLDAVESYAHWSHPEFKVLAKHFWPGPLTLLLPRKNTIPDLITSGLPRVGLRVPSHPLTLELLSKLNFPLAAPSANPFGYVSPTKAEHVMEQMAGKISYILDGGSCAVGVESTIIGMEEDELVVYRKGGVTIEHIIEVTGRYPRVLSQGSDPKALAAPGMTDSHYAPAKPLYFFEDPSKPLPHFLQDLSVGSISLKSLTNSSRFVNGKVLSEKGDLQEAAVNLFSAIRSLDATRIDAIVAYRVPDTGLGWAINDRLHRAAVKRA